eukprot:CAMPEP_0171824738 /NCGR_PEP_ID=MMETSP0992-20121227/5148_1 /TAXON_ID=483369 /ORGANISM="non described non described, Strain CCMP2098" /LENGTH=47 /DNA_ID= /DNA_START= /DNA_END= /DNA_ORIENTATION=
MEGNPGSGPVEMWPSRGLSAMGLESLPGPGGAGPHEKCTFLFLHEQR